MPKVLLHPRLKRGIVCDTVWLFYICSLSFSFLIIPFQFGYVWLSLGWLIESLILIVFALKIKGNLLERMGWMAYLLAYGNFFIEPTFYQHYYLLSYFLMVVSSIFLLHTYFASERHRDYLISWKYTFLDIFKYRALPQVLFYAVHEVNYVFENYFQLLYNAAFYHSAVLVISNRHWVKVKKKRSSVKNAKAPHLECGAFPFILKQ